MMKSVKIAILVVELLALSQIHFGLEVAAHEADDPTDNQIAEATKAFERFDVEKTGSVEMRYLPAMLRSLGYDLNPDEIEDLLISYDLEDQDTIDLAELVRLHANKCEAHDQIQEMIDAFRVFDEQHTGRISVNRLREILADDSDDFNDMLDRAQVGQDNTVAIEDLVSVLTRGHS